MIKKNPSFPEIFAVLEKEVKTHFQGNQVSHYTSAIDLKMRLPLTLPKEGIDFSDLTQMIQTIRRFSTNSSSHQFFNQLFSAPHPIAWMGDALASALNTTMATFEASPVATLIENTVIQKMLNLVGFQQGDGVLTAGGNLSNLSALLCARWKSCPDIHTKGCWPSQKLVIFISDQAHYSFFLAAQVLGIGRDQVITIPTQQGKMDPQKLANAIEDAIAKNQKPFFVGTTAGTTVLGAFDPIENIVSVARLRGLWVHVDGSFGGAALLSPDDRDLLKGCHLADSFSWDAHKVMGIPLSCAAFLTRHPNLLNQVFSTSESDYLFHDDEDGLFDMGKKSLQCGRRIDALKLWLLWQYYGDTGYAKRINTLINLAKYAEKCVIEDPMMHLASPRSFLCVCFSLQPPEGTSTSDFTIAVRSQLKKSNATLVNYATVEGNIVFRWVNTNDEVTLSDIDQFFDFVRQAAKVIHASSSFEKNWDSAF